MDNLLSALSSFPGGYFSDRIGTKRSLIVFYLVALLLQQRMIVDDTSDTAQFGFLSPLFIRSVSILC